MTGPTRRAPVGGSVGRPRCWRGCGGMLAAGRGSRWRTSRGGTTPGACPPRPWRGWCVPSKGSASNGPTGPRGGRSKPRKAGRVASGVARFGGRRRPPFTNGSSRYGLKVCPNGPLLGRSIGRGGVSARCSTGRACRGGGLRTLCLPGSEPYVGWAPNPINGRVEGNEDIGGRSKKGGHVNAITRGCGARRLASWKDNGGTTAFAPSLLGILYTPPGSGTRSLCAASGASPVRLGLPSLGCRPHLCASGASGAVHLCRPPVRPRVASGPAGRVGVGVRTGKPPQPRQRGPCGPCPPTLPRGSGPLWRSGLFACPDSARPWRTRRRASGAVASGAACRWRPAPPSRASPARVGWRVPFAAHRPEAGGWGAVRYPLMGELGE